MKHSAFARFALPITLVVVLVLALVPASSVFAAPATAAATSFTFTDKGTTVVTDVNPCDTTTLFNITLTYTNVFHQTYNDNSYHDTFTQQAQFVAVPVSGVGPTYTGHYVAWDGGNANNQNAAFTSTFIVIGTGSDGSTIKFTEVVHWSISATGGVVSFDKAACH